MFLKTISPSRAKDFESCPLKYKFSAIDKISSPPTIDTARGTHVHAVLEELLKIDRDLRTQKKAFELVTSIWDKIVSENEYISQIAEIEDDFEAYLQSVKDRVETYYHLEDPTKLIPSVELKCEIPVSHPLENGVKMFGYIDRFENANNRIRITDYKTGTFPKPNYQDKDKFQMLFYGYAIWKQKKVIPEKLRLIYLKDEGGVLDFSPTEKELNDTKDYVVDICEKIETAKSAYDAGDLEAFKPKTSKLCDWCFFQNMCPEFAKKNEISITSDAEDGDMEEIIEE